VLLPTPPLPLATATTFLTCGMPRFGGRPRRGIIGGSPRFGRPCRKRFSELCVDEVDLSTRGFSCRSVRKVLKNRRVVEFIDVAAVGLVRLTAPLKTVNATQKRAALTKCLSRLSSRRISFDKNERPPKGSTRKKPSAAPSTEGTATPQIPVRTIWLCSPFSS
jgi:hypothetical protein